MRKIISFMHISLDGFVAGPNGEMNWIKVDEEIFDYVGKRIGEGDKAMYGRVTFDMMENYWPTAGNKPNANAHDIQHSKWYAGVHKIVLSNTMKAGASTNATIINGDIKEQINKIKSEGTTDILLFGSPTATHALMQQDLIDGYWLFVNPVILGKGISLFEGITGKVDLTLLGTRRFNLGVTELNYIVNR